MDGMPTSRSSIKSTLPTATVCGRPRKVTCAVTPRPAIAWKSVVSTQSTESVESAENSEGLEGPEVVRSTAAATIAAANGCSESRSAAATIVSKSSGYRRHTPSGSTSVRVGLPAVIVPVLSSTTALTLPHVSSASAERTSTPMHAARPVETVTDRGVARPSAHGQAISRTDTAATSACVTRGSGPNANHIVHAQTAMSTTIGTKMPEIRSARRCTGAFELCAARTMPMICASTVSLPTFVAR